MITWAERLSRARRALGWKQQRMADYLGVCRDTVYEWESGNRCPKDPAATFHQLRELYLLIGKLER